MYLYTVVEKSKLNNRYHSTVICSSLEEVDTLIKHYVITNLKYGIDVFSNTKYLVYKYKLNTPGSVLVKEYS